MQLTSWHEALGASQSKMFARRSVVLASGLLTGLAPPGGYGQEAAEENRLVMEQIVVTARQREESIQDIPLAVTAFDQEIMQRRGIQDLQDVARFTAGFAFEDFDGGNANPVIRGQTTLRTFAREQTVAAFLDGVYMPRSWAVDLGMYEPRARGGRQGPAERPLWAQRLRRRHQLDSHEGNSRTGLQRRRHRRQL
jgi:outer membrane receptor protein involved in Fe transport